MKDVVREIKLESRFSRKVLQLTKVIGLRHKIEKLRDIFDARATWCPNEHRFFDTQLRGLSNDRSSLSIVLDGVVC